MTAATRTASVVTLIPPAVDPDAPPMNIRAIPVSSVASVSWPTGTVLMPAVRYVTDWNRALRKASGAGIPPYVAALPASNASGSSVPAVSSTALAASTSLVSSASRDQRRLATTSPTIAAPSAPSRTRMPIGTKTAGSSA